MKKAILILYILASSAYSLRAMELEGPPVVPMEVEESPMSQEEPKALYLVATGGDEGKGVNPSLFEVPYDIAIETDYVKAWLNYHKGKEDYHKVKIDTTAQVVELIAVTMNLLHNEGAKVGVYDLMHAVNNRFGKMSVENQLEIYVGLLDAIHFLVFEPLYSQPLQHVIIHIITSTILNVPSLEKPALTSWILNQFSGFPLIQSFAATVDVLEYYSNLNDKALFDVTEKTLAEKLSPIPYNIRIQNYIDILKTADSSDFNYYDSQLVYRFILYETLPFILNNSLEHHKNLKGKALFDATKKTLAKELHQIPYSFLIHTYIDILKTADQSSSKLLYQFMLREITSAIVFNKPNKGSWQEIAQQEERLLHEFKDFPDLQKEYFRWRYLLTSAYPDTSAYPEIKIDNKFGFSLRELLDYKRLGLRKDINYSGALDLSEFRLTDLDGLQEMEAIKRCNGLYLNENLLKELPADAFVGLDNIKVLNLADNKLQELPVTIFSPLTQLRELNLGDNELTTLPAGIFNSLAQLKELLLGLNQLKDLPTDIFRPLVQLEILNLIANKLEEFSKDRVGIPRSLKSLILLSNPLTEDKEKKEAIRAAMPASVKISW